MKFRSDRISSNYIHTHVDSTYICTTFYAKKRAKVLKQNKNHTLRDI